jgi:hypothetical protein
MSAVQSLSGAKQTLEQASSSYEDRLRSKVSAARRSATQNSSPSAHSVERRQWRNDLGRARGPLCRRSGIVLMPIRALRSGPSTIFCRTAEKFHWPVSNEDWQQSSLPTLSAKHTKPDYAALGARHQQVHHYKKWLESLSPESSLLGAEQAGWATLRGGTRPKSPERKFRVCGRVGHRRRKIHIQRSRIVP